MALPVPAQCHHRLCSWPRWQ